MTTPASEEPRCPECGGDGPAEGHPYLCNCPTPPKCPNCENGSGWTRHLGPTGDEVVEECHDHLPTKGLA